MNLNNVAAIINDDITTIACSFEQRAQVAGIGKTYDFKITKELAASVKPGDALLVETANGVKYVYAVEVHDETMIDPNSGINYAWVFDKLNMEKLAKLKEAEAEIVSQLKQKQRESLKQQALHSLGIKYAIKSEQA